MDQIHFTSPIWVFLLPVIAAGADILTGLLQAGVNNNYNSSVMRKGLYRKLGEIGCVVFAYLVNVAINLPVNITAFVSIYIVIMEGISVLENLSAAKVPVPGWILTKLKKAADTLAQNPEQVGKLPEDGDGHA